MCTSGADRCCDRKTRNTASSRSGARVQSVTDEVKEGDEILVKVLEVDRQGKIRLSRKEAMPEPKPSQDS